MSSSRGICGSRDGPSNRSSGSVGSGAHYALCALAVGLIALGIIMIVWTVIPSDKDGSDKSSTSTGNSTFIDPGNKEEEEDDSDRTKSSSVAMVLVGVGVALLLLSICLGVRNKRRQESQSSQPAAAVGVPFMQHAAGDEEEGGVEGSNPYTVPSYDEVVGTGNYPVRQSNLNRNSSMLPSYEDIVAAVENEGTDGGNGPAEDAPPSDPTPAPDPAPPAAEAQPAAEASAAAAAAADPNQLGRSSSRASRLLRPLRVRRIKSDKLHLKDFRLRILSPTQNPVTIEPITPPPQYDNKMPELG
ncbi:transmembrane protein 51b [Genypterus blacodes]|uniref:transmembrane protein 51b n=1 Tax=Genypterus blacodes TaxID=154954 RepID=UPI003F762DF5